jgi:SAM-dependent methyltransferase
VWIPALDGAEEKLVAGARVADIGCGHGASVVVMADAYPNSRFLGFDYHARSIETARRRAVEAGVGERTTFEVAAAKDYPGAYGLICFFGWLHDMGDPVGVAAYACTPTSLSQEVGLGLGAPAGEGRLRAVFEEAGFSRFRRALQTPLNLIPEGASPGSAIS